MPRYRGFILDLWGVIHDGSRLYPHALECLKQLRAQGKRVFFLSNAPRRVHKVTAVLESIGVSADLYEGVMSSGEAAYQAMAAGEVSVGKRYLYIGPERDADVLQGLSYSSGPPEEADFILNVGFGSEEAGLEDLTPLLARCLARRLPMLCLNPDMEVVKISGERFPCAGVIARQYVSMGGAVQWYGKPYPAVYRHCLARLAPLRPAEILAVGDGLYTDILGANNAGIDTLLIQGGILQGRQAEVGAPEALYVMPELRF